MNRPPLRSSTFGEVEAPEALTLPKVLDLFSK